MKKQIRIALAGIFTLALVATTAVPTLAGPTATTQSKKTTRTTKTKPKTKAKAKPRNTFTRDGNTFTVNGVSFTMIEVVGGTFTMGATPEQESDAFNEVPLHEVTLSTYYIGQTEVTQALWKAVMGNNPSYHKGNKNYPVEQVSWNMAQKFIAKLNRITGLKFRLPTEAEWEFAARGGTKSRGYKYSGSNNIDEVAWCMDNSPSETQPVGTKSPNELGIYDMSGNAMEWCQDWYGNYSSAPQTNPTGRSTGDDRVTRGGSAWGGDCYISSRGLGYPGGGEWHNGFRLAL